MGSGLLLFLLRQVGGAAVGNRGRKLQLRREVTTPQLETLGSHFHKWDELSAGGPDCRGSSRRRRHDVSSTANALCHMWITAAATRENNAAWASSSTALDANSPEWVSEGVNESLSQWVSDAVCIQTSRIQMRRLKKKILSIIISNFYGGKSEVNETWFCWCLTMPSVYSVQLRTGGGPAVQVSDSRAHTRLGMWSRDQGQASLPSVMLRVADLRYCASWSSRRKQRKNICRFWGEICISLSQLVSQWVSEWVMLFAFRPWMYYINWILNWQYDGVIFPCGHLKYCSQESHAALKKFPIDHK